MRDVGREPVWGLDLIGGTCRSFSKKKKKKNISTVSFSSRPRVNLPQPKTSDYNIKSHTWGLGDDQQQDVVKPDLKQNYCNCPEGD